MSQASGIMQISYFNLVDVDRSRLKIQKYNDSLKRFRVDSSLL